MKNIKTNLNGCETESNPDLVLVCTSLFLMFIKFTAVIMSSPFLSLLLCVSQMHAHALWLTASTAVRWWKAKFGASVHLPASSSPQMAGHAWVRLLAVSQTNSATSLRNQKHTSTKKHNVDLLRLFLLLPLACFLTLICSLLIKHRSLLLPFFLFGACGERWQSFEIQIAANKYTDSLEALCSCGIPAALDNHTMSSFSLPLRRSNYSASAWRLHSGIR